MILQTAQLVEAVHAHCHGQPMQNTRGIHAGSKNMAAPVGPWSLKMTQQQPWLSNCAVQPVCLNNPSCSQNAFRIITCTLPSQEYSCHCHVVTQIGCCWTSHLNFNPDPWKAVASLPLSITNDWSWNAFASYSWSPEGWSCIGQEHTMELYDISSQFPLPCKVFSHKSELKQANTF